MTRSRFTGLLVGVLCLVSMVLGFTTDANALTLKANSVANLTTVTVFTVPIGVAFAVTSVVVSNDNAVAACCQRLFRSGLDVTAFIEAPAKGSFQATFNPGIRYTAGQTVQVRNGASSGPISFTVTGEFVSP